MGPTLSQRKKALKQALILAKPTAEILHAAAELQRAIQGGAVGPSSGTNPTARDLGEWGGLGLSEDLRAKAETSLVGSPYEGWQISDGPLSPPLTIYGYAGSGGEDLMVNLRRRGATCSVALREVHKTFAELAAAWTKKKKAGVADAGPAPKSLACVLIKGWWDRPPRIEAECRKDTAMLSVIRVSGGAPHPARLIGMKAGGHTAKQETAPQLPLFRERRDEPSVAILDLVDAAKLPVIARGKGAPLPLRLGIRTLARVPLYARLPGQLIEIEISVRELRDALFPRGWQRWRDWPRMRAALVSMGEYSVIIDGTEHFPWSVRRLPTIETATLDAKAVIFLDIPPGTEGSGPIIDLPVLDELGADSVGRYRAYIASHMISWRPGATRVRNPRNGRWVWGGDESQYPVLNRTDRRLLAFGPHDKKHRTRAETDAAFQNLPGISVLDERATDPITGKVGWRVVPSKAADAIARKRERTMREAARPGKTKPFRGRG